MLFEKKILWMIVSLIYYCMHVLHHIVPSLLIKKCTEIIEQQSKFDH